MGTYSIFPTGTTIYDREKAWNGYTVFHAFHGAVIIDMNGNVVHMWKGLNGSPSRLLPGGHMLGTLNQPTISARFEKEGEKLEFPDLTKEEMVEADWDGSIIWRLKTAQHHDYQIEGNTVGYPVPGMEMHSPAGRKLLVLANCISQTKERPGVEYLDDCILEYDEKGNVVWQWTAMDHLDEFGLSPDARKAALLTTMDWCHLNAVCYIGENKHYREGNKVFSPDNILASSRELSMVFIIRKSDGKIIWKRGAAEAEDDIRKWKTEGKSEPDSDDPGIIIGQHHVHMIPEGMPGAGNLLLFDNGGFSGYGPESILAPLGRRTLLRHYSRVLELDPVSWKIVWEYRYDDLDITASGLFSPLLGCVQRLPNGNTLVTEGCFGRIMEITPEKEVVWEYISNQPSPFKIMGSRNTIYRAYRVPYDYLPFLEKPVEIPIPKIDNFHFQMPGAGTGGLNEGDVVEITENADKMV